MKYRITLLVAALIIIGVLATLKFNELSNQVTILYLAQERAESAARAQFEQGRLWEAKEQYVRAISTYKDAAQDPRTATASVAARAKRRTQAKLFFKRPNALKTKKAKALAEALKLDGEENTVWSQVVQILVLEKTAQLDLAIKKTGTLLSHKLVGPMMTEKLGALLVRRNKPEAAVKTLTRLLEINPNSSAGWIYLGDAFASLKRNKESMEAYESALKIEHQLDVLIKLVKAIMKQGQWKLALDRLTKAKNPKSSKDAEFIRLIAACQYQLKNFSAAARNYQNAYDLEAEPRTLLSKAIALQASGNYTLAIETLDAMKKHEGKLPQVHFQRAQLFIIKKNEDAAMQAFSRFLRLAEKMPTEKSRVEQATQWMQNYRRKRTSSPQNIPPTPNPSTELPAP